MTSTKVYNHMYHQSPLSERLHNLGYGIVTNVRVDSNMYAMNHTAETTIEYTIQINGVLNALEDFEEELLSSPEHKEMKRIIESNPELRDMYEKYKIMDRLKGTT